MVYAKLFVSPNKLKKYRAVFYDEGGKKIKHTDFGASGMSDYTIHKDKQRKKRYIARHRSNENWDDYTTAGSLSRYVLWEKPSLKESWEFYKRKFKLL